MTDTRPSGFHVLSFLFQTSHSGCVALDGFGVIDDSVFTSRIGLYPVAARLRALRYLLARSVRRFRPAVVVLGVSRLDTQASSSLRREARRLLQELHIPVVTRSVREGYELLSGRIRGRRRHTLAHAIVEGFLPELAPQIPYRKTEERRVLSIWHAAAVALRELVERFPRVAAGLARPEAFRMGRFRELVTRAEKRLHPAI